MSIKLQLPKLTELKPRIVVFGVGGAGGNAVNNMIASGLVGVEFVVTNTDAQALALSTCEHRIQLGVNLTEGLGAGSRPEIGEAAAEEAADEIRAAIAGAHMVFIGAGMGGGTGTGAAGVIARLAKEHDILTVGIVTKPFLFEGARRMRIAEAGIAELKQFVDTLIVIPNQNLFRVANERTTFAEAFVLADQVLYSGISCIVDLILKDGLINLDFADVRTVMSGMGTAMMGTGEASGERRAVLAAQEAIANPLLDDVTLNGARGLLVSILGGKDLTLYEVDEAASRVRKEVDPDANIIVGAAFDETLGDRVRVSIVASGLPAATAAKLGAGPERTDYGVNTAHAPPPQRPQSRPLPPDPTASLAWQPSPPAPPKAMQPPPPPASQVPHDPADDDFSKAVSAAIEGAAHPQSGTMTAAPIQRETWRTADGVVIEDGLPPANVASYEQLASPPSSPQAQPQYAPFTPQAPSEVPRTGRRMPEVEDFPVVGQRDYRAKSGGVIGQAPPEAAVPKPQPAARPVEEAEPQRRKRGLLERLSRR